MTTSHAFAFNRPALGGASKSPPRLCGWLNRKKAQASDLLISPPTPAIKFQLGSHPKSQPLNLKAQRRRLLRASSPQPSKASQKSQLGLFSLSKTNPPRPN